MKASHLTDQSAARRNVQLAPMCFIAVGVASVFIQCRSNSPSNNGSGDSTSTASSSGASSTTNTTENTSSGETSSGSTASTETGPTSDAGGSGGSSGCPSIWKGCPALDTKLEPLHERVNGAGALLLAHDAFWLQGSVTFKNPDGSRGENFLGALRIPYEPGSTPRVLEGNVTTGAFAAYDGRVYHPDFGDGGLLAVYEPNGDLHHVLDVAQGDSSAVPLQSPTFLERTLILTTPNCRSLFFINIDDWNIGRLDTEGRYLGGTTSLTLVDDQLYCMGDGYIHKVDVASRSVLDSWIDPLLEDNVQEVHYRWLWNTPQGLITWIDVPGPDSSLFQTVDPDSLAFTDYFETNILMGAPHYLSDENSIYFWGSIGSAPAYGFSLHRFRVETKATDRIVPEQRPWGGDWDFKSELQMDDDYFYWIEGWDPDGGATTLNSAQFIVRYPRED